MEGVNRRGYERRRFKILDTMKKSHVLLLPDILKWVPGGEWTSLDKTRYDLSLCPIVFLCLAVVDSAL